MSKLCPSTFFCAFSIALLIQGCSIGTSSSIPRRSMSLVMRSAAKMRIRSSSSDRKKRELPGSPCRPARPRSWLSMRRDSWRSVPRMCSPPAASTSCFSASHCALNRAKPCLNASSCSGGHSCPGLPAFSGSISARAMNSALPPRMMSVPRPAMLVEIVTAPLRPACATTCASFSCCLAFSTLCGIPFLRSNDATTSDFSTLTVPTSTGWPRWWQSTISSTTARNLPRSFL